MIAALLQRLRRASGTAAATGSGRLHEHEAVHDVAARLLAAMDAPPARSQERGGTPFVVLFTSLQEGQGTSTIAAAVARCLAEAGRRTALSVVREASGVTPPGLIALHEAVERAGEVAVERPPLVTLLVPPRYTELPESARHPSAWLRGVELMIVDARPLADSLTRYLVPRAHGVVLVVDGEMISVRAVVRAREHLVESGGTLLGVVLNRYRSRIPRFIERYLSNG